MYLSSILSNSNINKIKLREHDVGSEQMLCRSITHASYIYINYLRIFSYNKYISDRVSDK